MPPTGEHADQPQPRPNVPVATSVEASLIARNTKPFVCPRIGEHLLNQPSRILLLCPNSTKQSASILKSAGHRVTPGFQFTEAQDPRTAATDLRQVQTDRVRLSHKSCCVSL